MSCDCVNGEKKEYGVYFVPAEKQNVALETEGAAIVKSGMSAAALNGDFTDFDGSTGYTEHFLYNQEDDDNPGIVIRFRHQYLLNRLKILLWDKDTRSYSYYVDVSLNNKDWVRICDRSKYSCRSWQYIAFPRMVVRYVRIVGTYNTCNNGFHVVFVNAYFSKNEVHLNRKWEPILGILAPTSNVATPARGACVIEGAHPQCLLDGQITGYNGSSGFTTHKIGEGGITVQLSQPFLISSMRLLLWDADDRSYSYVIHVSTDRSSNWTLVCNRAGQKSWQNVEFEPLPVVYIRIMGIHNTANAFFHCVHLECPSAQASVGTVKTIGDID